jgi:hypothetical protein
MKLSGREGGTLVRANREIREPFVASFDREVSETLQTETSVPR